MANKIILKKSSVVSKVPLATDLDIGEIAVNLADQKLYSKNASGTVILVGNSAVGTVTSVTGTSPVASSGGATPAISLASGYGDTQNPYASKTANYVLAAPNGSAGVPTFRAIVAADIPTLNQNTTGSSGSCTGNAATATTLQTARTLWGQSFNGSTNITGALSSVTTMSMSGQLTNTVAIGTAPFVITSTTRVSNLNVATAGTADTLTTARTINGTSFNGSANITTTSWGTARTVTLGSTGKSVDGSANISWTINEIGAAKAGAAGSIVETPNTISANYTMTTGSNGMSAGPMSIASGVTVTVPTGSTWVIV